MFGKRSNDHTAPRRALPAQEAAPAPAESAEAKAAAVEPRAPAKPEPSVPERRHSEEYYDVKTTVFNALIDTIDLTQLAKLEAAAAREEIRDIVSEIIQIKNVVMSIAEQEELLEDICNDVLGYGPLEPLLARDDIADIMVNGANTTYIEVGGKMQRTGVRFADNAQLMNICQRIVSQVGRRVDESSPICDARLPDGSRVNVIAPPLAIDGPTLTIRKFKKDRLKLEQLVKFKSITPRDQDHARDHRPGALQRADLRRHRLGQDDAAQLHDRLASITTSASSPARTPPSCSCSSRTWCVWRRARPTSRARARSPCAIWSGTACACGPSASSSARCADRRRSTCCRR